MRKNKSLDQIKKELKKSSDQLFKPAPPEIEQELKDESMLGQPENLIDRKDEEKPNK